MKYLGRVFDITKVILTDTAKKPKIIKITQNIKTIYIEGENV